MSLGYVGIEAAEPGAWAAFATEILGAQVGDAGDDGTQYVRFDEHAQRLTVRPGTDGKLAFLGWEVGDARNLAALVSQLGAFGYDVQRGTRQECSSRRVRDFVWIHDPAGNRVELAWGADVHTEPFRPARSDLSGFVALGHAVLGVPDMAASERFYVDVLGFRVTDYMDLVSPDRPRRTVTFLRCADGRNHSVAFTEGDGLDHLLVEVRDIDDVGRTLSLCRKRNVPMRGALGRHTNDLMISFYLFAPNGLRIEYGCGGTFVDDETWNVRHLGGPSLWGHSQG